MKGDNWYGELLNKNKKGSRYWESVSISPITDNKGNISHFVGIKEDITDEKSPIPVDIFTIKGEFVGTSGMESQPILITGKWAYCIELSDENLLLVKYLYNIK
jgi:hypothetical protein